MRTTRYPGVSAPSSTDQQDRIRALRDARQVPEPGTDATTDYILAMISVIADDRQGSSFDAAKIIQWLGRLPMRVTSVQAWRDWAPETTEAIAKSVVLHGKTSQQTAIEYGTTPETVDDIVAAYRLHLRRQL